MKIAFSVDDISPVQGFGGNKERGPLGYLKKLNEEFGCKFDLFTIPNFQGQASIDQTPEWCEWLQDQEYLKVQAHGLYHKNVVNQKYKHMELAGLKPEQFEQTIKESKQLFEDCGFSPTIFKAPGWEFPQYGYKIINKYYNNLADHFMSDEPQTLSNGLNLIPYTRLGHKLHTIPSGYKAVLHYHINPQGGDNGFTEELYQQTREFLKTVESERDVEYVFMEDLVDE